MTLFKEIARLRLTPPDHLTIKNVSHNKSWNSRVTQPHVEPPLIHLIKGNHDDNSEKYFVKLKLRRDPTLSSLNLYEFKTDLFENGEPEEFLLFVRNLNMTLAASGTLATGAKNQYLCTIFSG